jgi:hypothetical protein
MTHLDKDVWENRHTTRLFSDTNTEINAEDLTYLQTVINNTPSQCSIKSHFWILLGKSKEDMKIRKWLLDNVYYVRNEDESDINPTGSKEHMIAVLQAPAILHCVRTSDPWANPEEEKSEEDHERLADRSEGFFAGVILATLKILGYEVATFGCTAGFDEDPGFERKGELYTDMIKDRYTTELKEMIEKFPGEKGNWEDINFWPGLSTCFGPESVDNLERFTGYYNEWNGYKYINGRKERTPATTCIGF